MRKNRYVIAAFVIVIVPWSAFAAATSSARDMRAQLIGGFLESAGCSLANARCGQFTRMIAADDATPTPWLPVFPAASFTALETASLTEGRVHTKKIRAAAAIKIGNALLQNLPVLFALNALFSGASNGLLTPGPASLANIIILYQIFFTPDTPAVLGVK